MTRLSPEGTALTLPLNHPVVVAVDAILKNCRMHRKKHFKKDDSGYFV
jgi:hypothetical protein